jgi:hypothetical protein
MLGPSARPSSYLGLLHQLQNPISSESTFTNDGRVLRIESDRSLLLSISYRRSKPHTARGSFFFAISLVSGGCARSRPVVTMRLARCAPGLKGPGATTAARYEMFRPFLGHRRRRLSARVCVTRRARHGVRGTACEARRALTHIMTLTISRMPLNTPSQRPTQRPPRRCGARTATACDAWERATRRARNAIIARRLERARARGVLARVARGARDAVANTPRGATRLRTAAERRRAAFRPRRLRSGPNAKGTDAWGVIAASTSAGRPAGERGEGRQRAALCTLEGLRCLRAKARTEEPL